MKIRREDLAGTAIQRLVVTEPQASEHFEGEVIGYLCSHEHCRQTDETLTQIYHEPECPLAGAHDRPVATATDGGRVSE